MTFLCYEIVIIINCIFNNICWFLLWLVIYFIWNSQEFPDEDNFFGSVDSTKWFLFAGVLYTNAFAGDKFCNAVGSNYSVPMWFTVPWLTLWDIVLLFPYTWPAGWPVKNKVDWGILPFLSNWQCQGVSSANALIIDTGTSSSGIVI